MDNVQIIHTPKGDDMVVLPRRDYERLLRARRDEDEDSEDARLANEQLALIKAGKLKMIPLEDIRKKMKPSPTHPVAIFRKHRGLTAAALAKKAGVSRVTITHIENRTRKGTVANYQAIARALGVKVDSIIEWSDR